MPKFQENDVVKLKNDLELECFYFSEAGSFKKIFSKKTTGTIIGISGNEIIGYMLELDDNLIIQCLEDDVELVWKNSTQKYV